MLKHAEPTIVSFLKFLRRRGFELHLVDCDGEALAKADPERSLKDSLFLFSQAICAVDECSLYVSYKNEKKRYWIYIGLWNEPSEIIFDYSYRPEKEGGRVLDEVCDEWFDKNHSKKWLWIEKKQWMELKKAYAKKASQIK